MSDDRKRKKNFYKAKYGGKKARYNKDIGPKMKGFIVTTSGKERSATLEAYRLLNEYADKRYGPEKLGIGDENDSDVDDDDIETALKKQVTDIKEASKKGAERRFIDVHNKAKNVMFIKTNLTDPTELVTDIFNDLKETRLQKTQHCQRLIPVIETCYAKIDQMCTAARPLIEDVFHNSTESFSFSIKWKARCNNSLKRENVFTEILKIIWEVEKGHTTDYDHPEVVFNIDILGNVCCFGFLRSYHKFAKYNVEMVCKDKKVSPQASPKSSPVKNQVVARTEEDKLEDSKISDEQESSFQNTKVSHKAGEENKTQENENKNEESENKEKESENKEEESENKEKESENEIQESGNEEKESENNDTENASNEMKVDERTESNIEVTEKLENEILLLDSKE